MTDQTNKEMLDLANLSGFRMEGLGGGCMGWERTVGRVQCIITVPDDPSQGDTVNEPYLVGLYWLDARGIYTDEAAYATFPDFAVATREAARLLDEVQRVDVLTAARLLRDAPSATDFNVQNIMLEAGERD